MKPATTQPTTLNWGRVVLFIAGMVNAFYAIKYGMACGVCEPIWTCAAVRSGVIAICIGVYFWRTR